MKSRVRSTMVAGLALGAAVLGSCGTTPDTGIRLVIDASLMPGHNLTRVHVRTYDTMDPMRTIDEHDFAVAIDRMTVPFSMSIVPRDPSHPNMHLGIEVLGTVGPGPLVAARVHTGFIPGRILVLPVVLRDGCMPACEGARTCGPANVCVDAMVDPNTLPIYGVDAARDVAIDTTDVPNGDDVVDTGPPPMDVLDVVDAPIAMDVLDAVDAMDVPDVIDAADGPIAMDVIDVPVAPDVVDVRDVVDVPTDTGFGIACGIGFCPNSGMGPWLCGPPPMMTSCCQPNPSFADCSTVTCTNGYGCIIDPMGHPACCGPPIVP